MRGVRGSIRLVPSRTNQSRRARFPWKPRRFVFAGPQFAAVYASNVRGRRPKISPPSVVKCSPVYGQNGCLTSTSIMMHTRPPFTRKGLILLGGGVIVDKLWITESDPFFGTLSGGIRCFVSGF